MEKTGYQDNVTKLETFKITVFILENFITRRSLNLEHTTKAETTKDQDCCHLSVPFHEGPMRRKNATLRPKAQVHSNELRDTF